MKEISIFEQIAHLPPPIIITGLRAFQGSSLSLQLTPILSAPVSQTYIKMYSFKCFKNLTLRHVVNVALILAFMSSAALNVQKYSKKNTVVAESVRIASEAFYPSITMCPAYYPKFAHSKNSGTKNLTEYFESLHNNAQIKKDIVSISQPYNTKNG